MKNILFLVSLLSSSVMASTLSCKGIRPESSLKLNIKYIGAKVSLNETILEYENTVGRITKYPKAESIAIDPHDLNRFSIVFKDDERNLVQVRVHKFSLHVIVESFLDDYPMTLEVGRCSSFYK